MIALSCGFPPSINLPTYARLAESLGYERVWAYDSPALYGDVWVALARVAEATDRIGVGTGVAVPSLRHPVVTASAIATIEELAPGRLAVAFGTGFTARLAMGKRAMRWSDLARYVTQVRGLLQGDVVEVDGAACQLLYSPGFGPRPPIDVPLLAAPAGPKGFAVAHDVADGVVLVGLPPEDERRSLVDVRDLDERHRPRSRRRPHERAGAPGRGPVVHHRVPRDVRMGARRAGVDAGW